jgi:hypothetical protein
MVSFCGNFYVVKGRIKEFLGSTGLGFDKDGELDQQVDVIIPVLEKLVNKLPEIKKTKNSVFYIEFEDGKWLESSRTFKQIPVFTKVCKECYSPANWKKFNKMVESFDSRDNFSESMSMKRWALIGK